MRHPNGYGTVVKLSGNRRKPYAVRKTVGWNEKGHPIIKAIGYTETREEGLIMLAEYNKSPYDLSIKTLTMADLFAKFIEKNPARLGEKSIQLLRSSYNHCAALHDVPWITLRAWHMQACIDNCGRGSSSQAAIRNVFYHLERYATELDIAHTNYSALLKVDPMPESNKQPFTDEEIERVWQRQNVQNADLVLLLLYSGWRISEALALRVSDIDLAAGTMRGGTKTKSGKNRIVPIHPRILPLIRSRIDTHEDYLFTSSRGNALKQNTVKTIWGPLMRDLGIDHTAHECRHTFRSRLDSAGANKRCIDLLMGHSSKDVGERIYTHKTIDELRQTILLLN